MNPPTEIELKQFLASRLPETIEFDKHFERFHWRNDSQGVIWPEIKDTEWHHVVGLVEGQLSEDQLYSYGDTIIKLLPKEIKGGILDFAIITKWPTRATALMEVLK